MFRYWPIRKLQEMIGDENLSLFEKIIPHLSDSEDPDGLIGNKQKLAALVEALQDHDYFRKLQNLIECLNYVPENDLIDLKEHLTTKTASTTNKSLAQAILSSEANFEIFISYFNLDSRFLAETATSIEPFFDNIPASAIAPKTITKSYKQLNDYQYQCMDDASKLLQNNMSRAILQMPTGSGKTRTASEIIATHLNDETARPRQVLWLANTRELCEQAVQCMVEVWDHVGKKTCRFNRVWDGNVTKIPSWTDNGCVFTVASLQTLHSLISKDPKNFEKLFHNTSLTIVDEAHIAVAPTYANIIRNVARISECKILGLTATPTRIDDASTSALADLFFNSIASLEDPNKERDNTIAYLRSLGIMSEAFHHEICYSSHFELSQRELASLAQGGDLSDGILKRLGSDVDRTVNILIKLINLLNQGAKIIYFAPSVQNSFIVSAILNFLEYKSIHISAKTSPNTRDTIIQGFKENKFQILCNYGVLATGFDAPQIDVVCIGRPTTSPVLYSQMIGRGMRGPKVGGTEQCVILEVTDNFLGLSTQDSLYKVFKEYWENDAA